MTQREPQKVRLDTASEDTKRNSELVLDLVLSYLPTRDCVRTSILSSSWRYRWTTVPILVFDKNCCPLLFEEGYSREGCQALANIISRFLILHTGPIRVFQVKDVYGAPEVDCWILRVSRGSIQTLVLDVEQCDFNYYKLPSSVYSCGSLINLDLGSCRLSPPSYFKGFKNLKRLKLDYVAFTSDVLENLISSCPLLEELTLLGFFGLDNLHINAPNLKVLCISGDFESITFGDTMNRLLVISITLDSDSSVYGKANLVEFLTSLPCIQRFELGYGFLLFLTAGLMPERLSFQCKDLYYLAVDIDFCDMDEGLAAVLLFRSSPNLTELNLRSCTTGPKGLGVWADRNKCYLKFERLQWVTMSQFHGRSAELDFLKFVLESSPVLEKLTIIPHLDDTAHRVVKCIYGFKRASSVAKIIFDNIGSKKAAKQFSSA